LAQSAGGSKPGLADTRDESVEIKNADAVVGGEQSLRDTLAKPFALSLQNARLEDVLKTIKRMTQTPSHTGVPIFVEPEGLKEAGASIDSPVTIDATKAPLKTALDTALRPLKLGATLRDGLLVVTSRSEVALIEVRNLSEQLQRLPPKTANSSGKSRSASPPSDATEDPKDKLIHAALEKAVDLHFEETPFDDAIKEIRKVSAGPGLPDGIPIYYNPNMFKLGFPGQVVDKVTLDLKDVKLKTSLRLMLSQAGLAHIVKEGLLIIDQSDSPEINPRRGGFQ